jgi:DHA1 family bicyclomycin/chloramphenicol resistance-like MFS transporter
MVGRKPPMIFGLALYIAGSLGCALATSVEWLIAARVVQAFGGASLMVIPRAIIRDLYTGPQATRLMATIMLVIAVSPMLAPLGGSALIAIDGWRAIFFAMAAVAVASLLLTILAQPETLSRERRVPVDVRQLVRDSLHLLREPKFMGLTFIGAFSFASFFVFIASASFVYTGYYGLTPTQFSLAFAVNAIGFFAASQFAATLGLRHGMGRTVAVAITGFAAMTVSLLLLQIAGFDRLPVLIGMLFGANAFLGIVIPSVMVMALDDHGRHAGLASSLGGTLQMVTGAAIVGLSAPFFDGTPLPMVASIAACAISAWLLSRLALGRSTLAPEPAAGE